MFNKQWWGEQYCRTKVLYKYESYEFEEYELVALSDYDYILTKGYGDYMILPSVEEGGEKHFINAYKPKVRG